MSVDLNRLADAVATLAATAAQPEIRAQLHALSGIVRNLGSPAPDSSQRKALEDGIRTALAGGDEPAALAAAQHLARIDRAPLLPVDWSAASGG